VTQLKLKLPNCPTQTLSLSDGLVKIIQLLENAKDIETVHEAICLLRQYESLGLKSPNISLLRTCQDCFRLMEVTTSTKQLDCSPTLGMTVNGKFLIQAGFSPKIESGYTLSESEKTCHSKVFSL